MGTTMLTSHDQSVSCHAVDRVTTNNNFINNIFTLLNAQVLKAFYKAETKTTYSKITAFV